MFPPKKNHAKQKHTHITNYTLCFSLFVALHAASISWNGWRRKNAFVFRIYAIYSTWNLNNTVCIHKSWFLFFFYKQRKNYEKKDPTDWSVCVNQCKCANEIQFKYKITVIRVAGCWDMPILADDAPLNVEHRRKHSRGAFQQSRSISLSFPLFLTVKWLSTNKLITTVEHQT